MKEKLRQLKNVTHRKLTDDERAAMKSEFSAYLSMHPIQHTNRHVLPGTFATLLFYLRSCTSYATVGFAVAAMFTIGASEFSLPNESLYSVKTNFNERVLLASTYFSPALYAQAGHTVYARRLAEAEQLLLLDQLTADTADTMQSTLDEQEAALDRSLARAEAANGSEAAAGIRAHIETTRAKYDPILDILQLRKNVENPAVIDALLDNTLARHAAELRANPTLAAFTEVKIEVMEGYATELLNELDQVHLEIQTTVTNHGTSTETVVTDEIAAELQSANKLRDEAEAIHSTDPERAIKLATEAQELARSALDQIREQIDIVADEDKSDDSAPDIMSTEDDTTTPSEHSTATTT